MPKKRNVAGSRRAGIETALAGLLLLLAGCVQKAAGKEPPADNAALLPKVTVATPVKESVVAFSEYTGRTEAPEAVEVRARASGHLVRADFREGDLVKKGDLLFVIDPRPYRTALARARAELQSARADHDLGMRDRARADKLHETNTIADREWDRQHSQVDQLAARVGVAEAAVAQAELDLEYAHVRSPISGRIGRMLVTPGNLVGPSTPTPLATVVSVDPLYVYVDIDEGRGLNVGRGHEVVAEVGFAGEEGHPHRARIDFVDNHVDAQTGTLKVRAVVDNPDGRLTHGLFARLRLPEGAAENALLISDRAVATDQDRRFVWVIAEDGKAAYRGVKLGSLQGGLRVVRDGLGPDDRVVVRGLQRVRPGAQVNAEVVAMRELEASASKQGSKP